MEPVTPAPLLRLENVSKVYGSCISNDQVSWQIQAGKIHALIGENGAGKSTLMKVIFGLEAATSGRVFWKDQETQWQSALQAKAAGLSMVHQHFMQAENLTALEHFAIEKLADVGLRQRFRPLPLQELEAEAEELSRRYHFPVPWQKRVADLSVGEQQRLEILKALSRHSELLILDEPTAVLSPQEVTPFLEQLVALKNEGMTLILITHKLKEVLSVADTISVLRRGRLVWSGPTGAESVSSLAEKMVGEDASLLNPLTTPLVTSAPSISLASSSSTAPIPRHRQVEPPPLLSVKLTGGQHRQDRLRKLGQFQFQLHPGEILGVAGVDGNGQDELIDFLVHPYNYQVSNDSEVLFAGQKLTQFSVADWRHTKCAWIPSDRLHQAAVLEMTAVENFLIGREYESNFVKPSPIGGGRIQWPQVTTAIEKGIQEFDVRPGDIDMKFSGFSGGNQQKIIAAREFGKEPNWVLACHPTRGIDLVAAQRIHTRLQHLRSQGVPTILVSADLDELMHLSDRILVVYRNSVRDSLTRSEFDAARIGRAMAGLT